MAEQDDATQPRPRAQHPALVLLRQVAAARSRRSEESCPRRSACGGPTPRNSALWHNLNHTPVDSGCQACGYASARTGADALRRDAWWAYPLAPSLSWPRLPTACTQRSRTGTTTASRTSRRSTARACPPTAVRCRAPRGASPGLVRNLVARHPNRDRLGLSARVPADLLLLPQGLLSLMAGRRPVRCRAAPALQRRDPLPAAAAERRPNTSSIRAVLVFSPSLIHRCGSWSAACGAGRVARPRRTGRSTYPPCVRLSSGDTSWDGRTGDLIAVPPARHSLQAIEDSAVLLTVAKDI
jgi:hypothetical protein